VLELAYFSFAIWALRSAGASTASYVLGAVVLVHYGLSFDRLAWLVKQ
jgi:hypothetical protein